MFLWAGWQSSQMPALPFSFKGQKRLVASKESRAEDESLLAVKRRPFMERALYVIGLSCVSAVSCLYGI